MDNQPLAFFESLLVTPSPSGYEARIQAEIRKYAENFAEDILLDYHGNLTLVANAGGKLRVMLAGHCDQIGLIVTYIDESGYIRCQSIGGWDPLQLVGQKMVVWNGTLGVPAVISRKPIHLLTDAEKKSPVQIKDLWLDIGAKNASDARTKIQIGDCVTLELGMQRLMNNCVAGPKMDNSAGLWVVTEALRRAVQFENLACAAYSVSTVQEEIGLRGARTSAFEINPDVGIAVDVTHATDCPTVDRGERGDVAIGKGPVIFRGPNMNPKVVARLIELADEFKIPYQLAALGKAAPNDTNALQITRGGVATGLIGIPNRYMHSAVETISLDDIDNAANLLAKFLACVQPEDDFRPGI